MPKRYSHVEDRDTIWVVKTDSLREVGETAVGIWKDQIAGWEALMACKQTVADKRFEAVSELAQINGYNYLPAQKVSNLHWMNFYKKLKLPQLELVYLMKRKLLLCLAVLRSLD